MHYTNMNSSFNRGTSFIVQTTNSDILVLQSRSSVRIIVTLLDTLAISQYICTDNNVSAIAGKFKNIIQLYSFLQSLKNMSQRWAVLDSNNLHITNIKGEAIKFTLKIIQDPLEISKIVLLKMLQAQVQAPGRNSNPSDKIIKQDIQNLKSKVNQIGNKLRGIEQLVEQLNDYKQKNTQDMREFESAFQQLKEMKVQIKKVQMERGIFEKSILRNYQSVRQQYQASFNQLFRRISWISQDLEKYNIPNIKKVSDQIALLLDRQIKVKDYRFEPDELFLKNNRKIHWLNGKIIKNLEDVKDYNKVIGNSPLFNGISRLRFLVKNIKNNGLFLGICNSKVKENIFGVAFNDSGIIGLNSCGYIINRGIMICSSIAKIKSNDIVKMMVSNSQGLVRWFCNDIEIAVADMGSMNKENIYPFVGLGFFNDEVEVLQTDIKKEDNELHQTYSHELERMNAKFGRSKC